MSDAILTLLKLGLLAAVYLFFAWVLWTALNQVRAGGRAPAPRQKLSRSGSAAPRGQVTIVEPPELHGSVLPVTDELTIGRAAACTLTLDDNYVSQQHASITRRGGEHLLDDLGSTNGTYVNRHRIVGPVVLKPGDRVQIGSTVLEFS